MGTLYIRRDSLAVNLKPSRSPRTLSWADDKFSCLRFFSFVSPQNYALFSFLPSSLFNVASLVHSISTAIVLLLHLSSLSFRLLLIRFNSLVAIIVHRCVSKPCFFFTDRATFSRSLKVAKRASKYAPRGRRRKKKEVSSSLGLSRSRSGSWSWEEGKVTELDR